MSASISFRSFLSKKSLNEIYYTTVRYKSAVGVDHANTKSFEKRLKEHIDVIYKKARNGSYHFAQYREKLFSRGPHKYPRVISIPTIRDKLALKALFELLHSVYGRGPFLHEIIKNVIALYVTSPYNGVLRLDVKDFYPSIKHDILFNTLKKKIKKKEVLNLIEGAISTATVSKPEGRNRRILKIGVPQGLSISNILANVYMLPIDKKHEGRHDYSYFRYVDDILVLCNLDEHKAIRDEIISDFKEIGLEVHEESEEPTKATYGKLSDGFTYLGYKFYDSTVTVREKSIDNLRESIIKIFTNYKYSESRGTELLEWVINLRITGCIFNNTKYGWLFFFSQINDLSLLYSLDIFVNKQLQRFDVDVSKIKTKKFIRAYHEITKNRSNTNYIPNFDNYSIKDKRRVLSKIFDVKAKLMPKKDIEYQFNKRIYRTVKDLERDLARTS